MKCTADMGGFCEQPGDCFCLDGYAGDNCDILGEYTSIKIELKGCRDGKSAKMKILPIITSVDVI